MVNLEVLFEFLSSVSLKWDCYISNGLHHDHVFIDGEERAKGRGTVSFMWVAREKAGVASRVGPRRMREEHVSRGRVRRNLDNGGGWAWFAILLSCRFHFSFLKERYIYRRSR